jgi:hypothetical protein
MVKHTKRTAAEQRLMDEVAAERFGVCLTELSERGLEGCAQWAYDQAEAFVAERRRRQQEQSR